MSTEVLGSQHLPALLAVAERLHGRSQMNAADLRRAAIRLGNYVAAGSMEIVITNDVFGVAGPVAWAIIDFRDGHEQVCVPVFLAQDD